MAVLMMGYSGTGKSYTSSHLAKVLDNTQVVHSAIARRKLNLHPSDLTVTDDYFDISNPAREPMDRAVYGEMLRQAVSLMQRGTHVIFDAGHWFLWMRKAIYTTLFQFDPEIVVLRTVCPEDVVLQRLTERRSLFGADDLYESPSIHVYRSTIYASESFSVYDTLPDMTSPVEVVHNTFTGEVILSQDRSDYVLHHDVVKAIEQLWK